MKKSEEGTQVGGKTLSFSACVKKQGLFLVHEKEDSQAG